MVYVSNFLREHGELTKQDMLTMINTRYTDGVMIGNQKHGILVCIPKISHPARLEEYRPLTLLYTDYKILARITANRLQPWMPSYSRASFVE